MAAKLEGLREAEKNLEKAIKKAGTASARAISAGALGILGEAMRNAPVDKGDLRRSGYAEVDTAKNGNVFEAGVKGKDKNNKVVVKKKAVGNVSGDVSGVVGFAVPYAVKQHEDLELNHPEGGGAKFLENAVNEFTPRIAAMIIREMEKAGF